MRGNCLALVVALILAVVPHLLFAAGGETQPVLKQDSSSQTLNGVTISTEITLRTGPALTPGTRAYLQLDIYSSAAESDEIQVALLNGFAAIALPPGIDLDGDARMLYYDPSKDSFEYMYSQDYPQLPRLEGAEDALAQAQSGQPQAILAGLRAICEALDPAIHFIDPADPRLTGGDTSYTLTGTSWLIPASVMMAELVNPFDPESSLFGDTLLRVSVPIKVTKTVTNPTAVIYIGALSTGTMEQDLLPDQIPPTALPLAPLPDTAASPAAEGAPGAPPASTKERPERSTQQPSPGDKSDGTPVEPLRRDRTRSETQDEQPAPPAAQPMPDQAPAKPKPGSAQPAGAPPSGGEKGKPAPPPPPQPIPTLVFGYDWVSLETELDLSALLGQAPAAAAAEPTLRREPAPEPPAEVEQPGEGAAEPSGAVDITPPEPTPQPKPTREPEPPAQSPGVREVPPGTLPEPPQEYRVPLKEITGSPSDTPSPQAPSRSPLREPGAPSPAIDQPFTPAPPGLGEMVLIPAGAFKMGAGPHDGSAEDDEKPQHDVTLKAYYIDKYPVTNDQFYEFCFSTNYQAEGQWQQYYNKATANEPVRAVSWNDATAYAKWAGKRLPNEAEWEKAARGTEGLVYPWGDQWDDALLPREDAALNLAGLDASASPYGVIGMAGVVWQWTSSSDAPYPFDPAKSGPGFERYVLRGGGYNNSRAALRCANRYAESPKLALGSFGFRCAKDAE